MGSIEGGAGLRDLCAGTGKFSPGATHTPSDLDSPTLPLHRVVKPRANGERPDGGPTLSHKSTRKAMLMMAKFDPDWTIVVMPKVRFDSLIAELNQKAAAVELSVTR